MKTEAAVFDKKAHDRCDSKGKNFIINDFLPTFGKTGTINPNIYEHFDIIINNGSTIDVEVRDSPYKDPWNTGGAFKWSTVHVTARKFSKEQPSLHVQVRHDLNHCVVLLGETILKNWHTRHSQHTSRGLDDVVNIPKNMCLFFTRGTNRWKFNPHEFPENPTPDQKKIGKLLT